MVLKGLGCVEGLKEVTAAGFVNVALHCLFLTMRGEIEVDGEVCHFASK